MAMVRSSDDERLPSIPARPVRRGRTGRPRTSPYARPRMPVSRPLPFSTSFNRRVVGGSMTDHIVNVEQAEEWNGREGDHWVQHADRYDALSQRITPHLFEAASIDAAD